jgi:nicotinate-nucleotide pyrophosphorylase (carboxylating)
LAAPGATGRAAVVARRDGVIAGLPAAALVADEMDKALQFEALVGDGAGVTAGQSIAIVSGPVRSLLAAERLMLNLLGHLSGIATLTRKYVDAIAGTAARIYDTRKTLPGWRRLEKYAVRQGGGHNHRGGLFDAILIKDNHLAFLAELDQSDGEATAQNSASAAAIAVRRARVLVAEMNSANPHPGLIVEVEVDSLAQLEAVLPERPDIVLLDNMSIEQLREAVALRNSQAPDVELEASGGVNLSTVRHIAETGVERISVGTITHSAAVLDLGLDWQ